jgi:thiaminase/transcriptional activator TenA
VARKSIVILLLLEKKYTLCTYDIERIRFSAMKQSATMPNITYQREYLKMIFKKMCDAAHDIINKIHNQPFNRELSQGTLPQEKFIDYLSQDALYLSDFAKALAITAARISNNAQFQEFIQFSLEAIQAERSLHAKYIGTMPTQEQSPACFMYTNYLLRMASLASVEEALASLLPCFWVYREVGMTIARNQRANNPYHEWIALYSSEQFDSSVRSAIAITSELGNAASEPAKEKMISAFVRSTQLEWLFWDSAYRQEKWLIKDECLEQGYVID